MENGNWDGVIEQLSQAPESFLVKVRETIIELDNRLMSSHTK